MKFRETVAYWWYRGDKSLDKARVLAFDLDQTLVSPKSGARFPRSGSDWKWQTAETRSIIQKAAADATIVIFTNQGGVVPDPAKKSCINLRDRIDQVLRDLALPNVRVYSACKDPTKKYRKPAPGMWEMLLKDMDLEPDMAQSVYVGDAAGRKQDHADTDLEFAKAVGLKFMLPEEFEEVYGTVKETEPEEPEASKEAEESNESESSLSEQQSPEQRALKRKLNETAPETKKLKLQNSSETQETESPRSPKE